MANEINILPFPITIWHHLGNPGKWFLCRFSGVWLAVWGLRPSSRTAKSQLQWWLSNRPTKSNPSKLRLPLNQVVLFYKKIQILINRDFLVVERGEKYASKISHVSNELRFWFLHIRYLKRYSSKVIIWEQRKNSDWPHFCSFVIRKCVNPNPK